MPVTIGPFTNVPEPGDPVTSVWAQDITQYAVDFISVAKGLVMSGQADCSASLGATTTTQDIVGATTGALACLTDDVVLIDADFDMRVDTAASTCVGVLNINAVEHTSQAILGGGGIPASVRATVNHRWRYVVPSNGNYTFKLRARTNTGTATIQNPHTAIHWQVFR